MERQILHVDVNNAFLSWTAVEMLKQGSKIDIREIPAVEDISFLLDIMFLLL